MPHKRAKSTTRVEERKKKGANLDPTLANIKDDTPRSASRILNALESRAKFRERGGKSGEDTGEYRPKKKKQTTGSTSAPTSAFAKEPVLIKGKEKEVAPTAIPPILPHEKLGDYNRRIENFLRPGVNQAIKSAGSLKADQIKAIKEAKEKRKAAAKGGDAEAKDGEADGADKADVKKRKRPDEDGDYLEPENRPVKVFAPKPGPRRLNDIAQAPPQLPHMRVSAKKGAAGQKAASVFTTLGRDPLNAGQKRLLEEERERVVKRYREIKEEREKVNREEREKVKAQAKTGGKKGKGKGKAAAAEGASED